MLVGRDEELKALGEQLGREAPAVVVVGEAGIGKTALLREACARAGLDALEGGGLEMLPSISHLPLARALGEGPPSGDAAAAAEFVLERVGDGALVLDDLHWADPDTLAVLPLLSGEATVLGAIRRGDPGAVHALQVLEEAGFARIELGPVGEGAARALLRSASPELSAEAVEQVVAHAHGNPLLLEELAKGDASEPTLRLSLLARLHPHSDAAKRSAARAALLRRPAGRELLGEGAGELVDAGLMVEGDEGAVLRHALLAEAIVEGMREEERREVHSILAAELEDPGEAARHHQAAGEAGEAYERAMEAAQSATRPAERASHLAVAAACASGEDADLLRLRAAAELNNAGEYESARALLEKISGGDPQVRAERVLHEGKALAALGRVDDAERCYRAGLELVEGTSSELEVRLLLAGADNLQQAEWGSGTALDLSRRGWELSRTTGFARAEAEHVFAVALYVSGQHEESIEHARLALSLARDAGNHAIEFKAGLLLSAILASLGRLKESLDVTSDLAQRARELRMRNWEMHARCVWAFVTCLQCGDYTTGLPELEELLARPLALGPQIDEMRYVLGTVLADVGRVGEARESTLKAIEEAASDTGRSLLLGTLAEVEWLAGRPEQAASRAREALAIETESPNRAMAELTLCWALRDTGASPQPISPETGFPLDRAAREESEGLAMLAGGSFAAAAKLFASAARVWAPLEARSELRCLYACGEAHLRAGNAKKAKEALLDAEARAEKIGLMPLLGRIRPTLREAGVRRAVTRGATSGALSPREQEVMSLVADGVGSAEIAVRLGIARSTVESLVSSAMGKLGAKTRRQAALLALSTEDG